MNYDNMTIELADCTNTLLREIAEKVFKRNDIAMTYAMAMVSSFPTDWRAVNEAIIARWSMSGLTYIKEKAHKIVAEKRKGGAT